VIDDLFAPVILDSVLEEMAGMDEISPGFKLEARTRIRKQVDRISDMIGEILDFTQGSQSAVILALFDYGEYVERLLEEIRPEAALKSASVELDSALPEGKVLLDPKRLRRVFHNLIHNATDAMPRGGKVLFRFIPNKTEVVTEIEDSGPGIAPEIADQLFEAFATHGKAHGTGLGLSISKQLVERMGGKMGVTSTPGEGSTFWFTAELEKQPVGAALSSPEIHSIENLRVLIVDDNATNRKILSHQLGSWGMIHAEAESGQRALELLMTGAADGTPYDLAILDLLMPGMDGFELARAIKSDPNLSQMHLVLLTSAGVRGDAATAHAAGIAAYLTKPVRQSQLFDCLTTVVSNPSNSSALAASNLVTKHSLREARPMSNKLILLAEDNIVNQKVAVRQLAKLGYRADAVANGREAVEALTRIPYDLVLMDCQMPEMDGYEATTEIRRREGTAKHTPIVAMTAHALSGDREKSIAAGMDDHITKPVKQEELARVLEIFFTNSSEAVPAAEKSVAETPPPVDLERLHQALGDDPDEVSEILDVYREQMAESLIKLDAAIAGANAEEINLIAHNCAGTSANCGMIALVNPFHELERISRENQLMGAADLSAVVTLEFERVKLFLAERFAPLAAQ